MSSAQQITILGSTGSIGQNTLDVVSRHPDRYRITALTANNDIDTLEQQCIQWQPEYAVMADHDAAQQLQQRLAAVSKDIEVLSGNEGLQKVASIPGVDVVVAGIVGAVAR